MRKLGNIMNPFTPNITFWYEHKTTADTVFDIVCGWLCETLVPDKDFFIKKTNNRRDIIFHDGGVIRFVKVTESACRLRCAESFLIENIASNLVHQIVFPATTIGAGEVYVLDTSTAFSMYKSIALTRRKWKEVQMNEE